MPSILIRLDDKLDKALVDDMDRNKATNKAMFIESRLRNYYHILDDPQES